ncbi:MAG: ORF6N domain-containing protein [Candidatus Scalindua sp.]
MKKSKTSLIPQESIEGKILLIRGKKVILDRDLALLYGVKTIRLREQVKRNSERFPEDFTFQLTKDETNMLVSQNAIPSKRSLGGYLPYVFTEHGTLMAANVIKSSIAIQASIAIVRTFTKLREMLATHKDLQKKIESMEGKYDHQFKIVFDVIKKLLEPPEKPKKQIGYR